ncbi:hypothetical protein [Mycobacteroides abscessus]
MQVTVGLGAKVGLIRTLAPLRVNRGFRFTRSAPHLTCGFVAYE